MKYIEDTTELNLLSNLSNNSPQKKKKSINNLVLVKADFPNNTSQKTKGLFALWKILYFIFISWN